MNHWQLPSKCWLGRRSVRQAVALEKKKANLSTEYAVSYRDVCLLCIGGIGLVRCVPPGEQHG